MVFADTAPTCVAGAPAWEIGGNTQKPTCPAVGGVEIQVQKTLTTTLACLNQAATTLPNDAYISTLVTPNTGYVTLVFHETGSVSATPSPGPTRAVVGYFFIVDPAKVVFQLNRNDPSAVVPIVANSPLAAKPAADFALGVLVRGSQITLYLNGVQIGQASDATYPSGGIGLCTSGDAIFRDVQVYSLKS